MAESDLSKLLTLTEEITGPPYDSQKLQEICDTAESMLWDLLDSDPQWSKYDFSLDGFYYTQIEKDAQHLLLRGAMWRDSGGFEPCEVEIRTHELPHPRVFLRYGTASRKVTAGTPEKLRFPFEDWLCVFEIKQST
jgi:hypothetical protein